MPIQQMLLGLGAGEVVGQQAYTSAGDYSWTAPDGVTSISIVLVGAGGRGTAGGAGGGGALVYKNNITVPPGNSYSVHVGAGGIYGVDGESSYWVDASTLYANGGENATAGSSAGDGGLRNNQGDGGGNGGNGGTAGATYGSGGGAGGYSGNGGNGSGSNSPSAGSGGAGGGGQSGSSYKIGGGGGGVGILGEGSSGAAGGNGGSGGGNGSSNGTPGLYGGGAGSYSGGTTTGAIGAVRLIWPGTDRQFPSTRTADE